MSARRTQLSPLRHGARLCVLLPWLCLMLLLPGIASAEPDEATSCLPPDCVAGTGFRIEIPAVVDAEAPVAEVDTAPEEPEGAAATGDPADAAGAEAEAQDVRTPSGALALPGGGRVWLTEDPAVIDPRLGVTAPDRVALVNGELAAPVEFHVYSNYDSFIQRYELLLFRAEDTDLANPIHVISGSVRDFSGPLAWTGTRWSEAPLAIGEDIVYLLRAYGPEDQLDETRPGLLRLVDRVEADRQELTESFSTAGRFRDDAQALEGYGAGDLRLQNIPITGSRVRIHGAGLHHVRSASVAGLDAPVDDEGKFVRELMLPLGTHWLPIELIDEEGNRDVHDLGVEVDGRYLFYVGIADLTVGQNDLSGNVEALESDDHYDDEVFVDGRLAFYLKGKIRGRYLITAQADTTEAEIEDLFDGFHRKDPRSLFRRLDPDRFYPVYGDDSTTVSDVDTQGKLYVRLDWDKSQALWGNYDTGITGNEFTQYNRSLYGGKLRYRSTTTTGYGDPRRELVLFGSEAQSLLAHNEFLGTGGSLYFLRHTDIVQGSEKVAVEVRERESDRVVENITLERGRDYEIDEIQGRLILTRPLLQVAEQIAPSIIKDTPLDGNQAFLVVDYEYVPDSFEADDATYGVRGKLWGTDGLGVGLTFVQESRPGAEDYQLGGGDVTLRAGRGTFLKAELAHSSATQTEDNFFSDDGGLTFGRLPGLVGGGSDSRRGEAYNVEGRVNLGELSDGRVEGSIGTWWKRRDDGFSTARADVGDTTEEYGGEMRWAPTDWLGFSARGTRIGREDGSDETSAGGQVDWRFLPRWTLSSELRHTDASQGSNDERALLGGLGLSWNATDRTLLYGIGQVTFDDAGSYERNDLVTLGVRTRALDRLYVSAESSTGTRGSSVLFGADYQVRSGHQLYGSYTYSTDRTDGDVGRKGIATFGQRSRLSNQLQVYSENQFFHGERQTGIGNSFGLDFHPRPQWTLGFSLQSQDLDDSLRGAIERHATSVSASYRREHTSWSSKLEYRNDQGDVDRFQWLLTNRGSHRLSESLRMLSTTNFSVTRDEDLDRRIARFAEVGFGLAYRPVWHDRLNLLSKYTFLYDLPSVGQDFAGADERSHVVSLEGLYELTPRWQWGNKLAYQHGEQRVVPDEGPWFATQKLLAVSNVRYHFIRNWDALVEYRWLSVREARDERHGLLLGLYRHLGNELKVGVGYNFTDFNDDLVNLSYENQGWFVNFVGKF